MPVDPNDSFIGGYAPYVRLQQEIENGKLHNQMLQQALQLAPQELQMRQQQLSQQKQMGDAQIAQIYGMLPAHQAVAMASVNEANAKIADLKQTTEMAKQLQAGLLDSQKYKNQQEKALADTASQTADLRLKLGQEELKRSGISGNTEATRNMLLNQQIPTIIAQSKADLNKTLAGTDELHAQTKSLQQQLELSSVQKEMALMQEMRQWPAEMRKQIVMAHADESTPLFNILKATPELLDDEKFLPYTQMIEGKMMKDPTIGPQLMAAEFEKKFGVPLPNQPQIVTPTMVNPGENFRKALDAATSKFYKDFPPPAPGKRAAVQQGTMPQQQAQPAGTPSGSVQQGASNDTNVAQPGASSDIYDRVLYHVSQHPKEAGTFATQLDGSDFFKGAPAEESVFEFKDGTSTVDQSSSPQSMQRVGRYGKKVSQNISQYTDQQRQILSMSKTGHDADPSATAKQQLLYNTLIKRLAIAPNPKQELNNFVMKMGPEARTALTADQLASLDSMSKTLGWSTK